MPINATRSDISLLDLLFKAEFTMGDHVIGTTPGGFKIRASHGASHEAYAGMKPADHVVAANMHAKAARDLNIKSAQTGSMTMKRQAANHLHIATGHREAGTGPAQTKLAASMRGCAETDDEMHSLLLYADVLRKAEGGEGSRGGKIVGHTSSGRPIYASGHSHYAGLKTAGGKQRPDAKIDHSNAKHVRQKFSNYSAADHKDAASAHHEAYQEATSRKNSAPAGSTERRSASKEARLHSAALVAHSDARSQMLRESGNHISQKRGGES